MDIYDFKCAATTDLQDLLLITDAEGLKQNLVIKAREGLTRNQYDILFDACWNCVKGT